ncbi:MAG: radical SAM family heme chaperone HemW [Salinivirgaceae bacterium]|nr:radical SAM family heme chaperone HemW [Salinivirgaceae bacterium]
MAGIYIHIPFCSKRCGYCDFFSTTQLARRHDYAVAVTQELQQRSHYLDGETVSTIYFGGGTPSVLNVADVELIIGTIRSLFSVDADAEITFEANPNDLSVLYLQSLSNVGINRLSIGVQSFSDQRLMLMNRRHNAQQAIDAVRNAQQFFSNISIDLIYGLPNMTIDEWRQQLNMVTQLGVQHLSAYHLSYEQGTAFWGKLQRHELAELAEQTSLDLFDELTQWALANNFEHYEISNLALPGYRSRHNSSYWQRVKYLGVGAAAHSYNIESRGWNVSHLAKYINSVAAGKVDAEIEQLTPSDSFNDYVITALRTSQGIDLRWLEQNYAGKMLANLKKQAEKYISSGHLQQLGSQLKLTHAGVMISNVVMEDLIYV